MRPIDTDAFKKYISEGYYDTVGMFKTDEYRMFAKQITESILSDIDEQPTIQPEKAQLSPQGTTSDTISRQHAIDIVVFECGKWTGLAKEISKQLKQLPTAQPEVLACGNGELVAQPSPQWIPISDRLPRDGTWNIFTDGKNISVERYKADAIDHFFPNGRWFQLEDVIAWMPLPEPYTK